MRRMGREERGKKNYCICLVDLNLSVNIGPGGGGRFAGGGCAAGAQDPLAYTRASSAEFCYPLLDLTPQMSLS